MLHRMPTDRWSRLNILLAVIFAALIVVAVVQSFLGDRAASEPAFTMPPLTFPHHVETVGGVDLWLVKVDGRYGYRLTCERVGTVSSVQVGVAPTLTSDERIVELPFVECPRKGLLVSEGMLPELDQLKVGQAGQVSLAVQPKPPGDLGKIAYGYYRGDDGQLFKGYGP